LIILGLYIGHNASACVIKDGELLVNWELERHTRIKHDFGYNKEFVEKTLNYCGMSWLDVDIVACNNPKAITRWIDKNRPRENPPFNIPDTGGAEYREFDLPHSKGIAVNHHLCHVAGAYYTSPYISASIISWDGGGDAENFATAHGQANRIVNYCPEKKENLASYWSSICFNNYKMKRIHDWDPGSGAGKIMGLSSYGTPGGDDLESLLKQTLAEAPSPNNFDPRARAFNQCEDLSDTTTDRSQNVAATLQNYTVKKLISEINSMKKGEVNLCYAGGLALNCIANRDIVKHTHFENLHVPPFPNDTGLAIGAALYVWHHVLGNHKTTEYFSPYTGPDYNVGTPDVEKVAALLKDEKIICYYEGRSESGPRALGHRSILCSPSIKNIRQKLNYEVKNREWYRPYAPIILEDNAKEMLSDYNEWSPYMQTSAIIKEEYKELLQGVNHVDNTTRPQILKKEHNEILYNIIKASGLPALLNTSFNYQEPIVETPEQAKATWEKMPVDVLVIGEKIYER
tara:strand:+ start:1478 stop:3022 length:1545 start_codon:yes stop_codon:yes gene_type:complete